MNDLDPHMTGPGTAFVYRVVVPYTVEDICPECGGDRIRDLDQTVDVRANSKEAAIKEAIEETRSHIKHQWGRQFSWMAEEVDEIEKAHQITFEDNPKLFWKKWKEQHPGPYLIDPEQVYEQSLQLLEGSE